MSDGGMIIAPTLDQKVEILKMLFLYLRLLVLKFQKLLSFQQLKL